MLKNNVEEQCRKISPGTNGAKSECAFAPSSGVIGFIDTSGACDGTRGIAFFSDRVFVNTDGRLHEIEYKNISGLQIISSFEDSFADELSVTGGGFELRISDYSLDKFELKRLLDELCKERVQLDETHAEQVEKYAEEIAAKLAEKAQNRDAELLETAARKLKKAAADNSAHKDKLPEEPLLNENERPVIEETVVDIPQERFSLPENYSPAPIPEDKINWISGENVSRALSGLNSDKEPEITQETENSNKTEPTAEIKEEPDSGGNSLEKENVGEIQRPKPPEIMNGVVDRMPLIGTIKPPKPAVTDNLKKSDDADADKNTHSKPNAAEKVSDKAPSEMEMRERIGNMDDDEMMSFLSDTLNEINDEGAPPPEQTEVREKQYETVPQTTENSQDAPEKERQTNAASKEPNVPEKAPSKWEHLTTEPIWGDIYIKASRNLRMLCESGKLTMEQMEAELKDQLLTAAEAFERITSDESRVPKVMIPKIAELKSAAENFDSYFAYGEDIAIRAMFFMLYQMLTYADRIAESPETKDRLNDFFRRFGSAGITLSMLDMRV